MKHATYEEVAEARHEGIERTLTSIEAWIKVVRKAGNRLSLTSALDSLVGTIEDLRVDSAKYLHEERGDS